MCCRDKGVWPTTALLLQQRWCQGGCYWLTHHRCRTPVSTPGTSYRTRPFLFGWWHGFFFCVAYLNLPCLCFIVRCVGKAQGDNDGTGGSLHDALLVQEDTRLTNFSTRTLRTRMTRTSRCILLPFLILLCCFTAHAMQRSLWCKVASLACWCREWWAAECLVLEPWSLSFHYVLVNGSEGVLLSCKLVMFLNVDIYIYTLAC
jgi:hypothetical protein